MKTVTSNIQNNEQCWQRQCKNCSRNFEITEEDRNFYHKISPVFSGKRYPIPEPSLCPDCRQQRRLAFRNERNLYNRKCDLSGKSIISIYDENTKFPVYDYREWWSDKWDPLYYGQIFDFSRNFFEQFQTLGEKVPRINLTNPNSENSEYTNYTANNKNCYLIFSNSYGHNENCSYGTCLSKSENCFDNTFIKFCQYCYNCVDCMNCYQLVSGKDCTDCRDSYFLSDCRSCSDCIACKGLRNKQYCIQNKQYTKEKYFKILEKSGLQKSSGLNTIEKIFRNFDIKIPSLFSRQINCQNVSGDYLKESKNCKECFDTHKTENSAFLSYATRDVFNTYDSGYVVEATDSYENISLVTGHHALFNDLTWFGNSDLMYSHLMFQSQNCFGCIGLQHKQYCVLNTQYTKEEYEKLVPKIIEHMQKTGEWGEFFPMSLSPFAYNETVAQEYFPLSKQEISEKNLTWKEEKNSQDYLGPKVEIPDNIAEVKDDICQKILQCEVTGKLYKITPQELKFYRKMNLPIPRKCPDQRHKERMALRNPRKLFERNCDKCQKEISTTYAPERPERVYCEECYLGEMY